MYYSDYPVSLNAARESQALTISEALASGIGLIVLFLLVAVAVAVFITSGSKD